jgi:hypothetical protein
MTAGESFAFFRWVANRLLSGELLPENSHGWTCHYCRKEWRFIKEFLRERAA